MLRLTTQSLDSFPLTFKGQCIVKDCMCR